MQKTAMNLATMLAVVAICSLPSLAQTANQVFSEQLITQQKHFLEAAQNKDSATVDHAVADDFVGIGHNGDFYDRGDVVDSARGEGMPKGTLAYDFNVIKLNDDSAVVAYNLVVPGDHPRYRHMSDTWAKVGGQWKLKFRQITPNLWSAADLD